MDGQAGDQLSRRYADQSRAGVPPAQPTVDDWLGEAVSYLLTKRWGAKVLRIVRSNYRPSGAGETPALRQLPRYG